MRFLFPILMLLIVCWGAMRALRYAFPAAYQNWLRQTLVGGVVVGALAMALWRLGRWLDWNALSLASASTTSVLWVSAVALFVLAPFYVLPAWWLRRQNEREAQPNEAGLAASRRQFLQKGLGVVPAGALSVGPAGAIAAAASPVVRRVEVPSDHVSTGLEGLKILQLTDIHLGIFMGTAQVRAAVEAVRHEKPDLVVLTGDIADELSLIPEAVAILRELNPSLGIFACIGNHEIYRGRAEAERYWRESEVPLLCNDGQILSYGAEKLWLCGADDPAKLGREHRPFLEDSVEKALSKCPADIRCRVLLSHRPESFEAAASRDTTLTLSGHTHGAQMALFGRSLLEWLLPKNYLLGVYRRGESALYTSAGLGHWFPFRLNCPCEVALVTLRAPPQRQARPS